jgi:hypothetical protein
MQPGFVPKATFPDDDHFFCRVVHQQRHYCGEELPAAFDQQVDSLHRNNAALDGWQ